MTTTYDGIDLPLRAFRLAGAVRKDRPMTDDLDTWGREQLDDDERLAHAVLGADASSWDPYGYLPGEKRDYLALYSPARVLAEVDAKRRILDEHSPQRVGHFVDLWCQADKQEHPCSTVRLLFLPYADREGFREEWRPA